MKIKLSNLIYTSLIGLLSINSLNAEEKINWPCSLNPPTITKTIPSDTIISDQTYFNCFAWQEFISLNQPIDNNESFGEPNSYTPVVFETYMNSNEFLKPDGSKPPLWKDRSFSTYEPETDIRTMYATSKITVGFDEDDDLDQAFPSGKNKAWLADKNGNLVWYEILVNEDEYNYIYEPLANSTIIN